MKAVILAAGRGSRLGSMTDAVPKGMMTVAGRPLLEWQRATLLAAGVESVTVVTGYRGDVIADHGFETIENRQWDQGNMISSLARALEELPGPLIVSYADILYGTETVQALMASPEPVSMSYDRDWLALWKRRFDDPLSDAETFRLDSAGNIVEIGGKASSVDEIEGQFMGLIKLEALGRAWVEELLAADPDVRLGLDTTSLLGRLIAAGKPIRGIPAVGGWCEVDAPGDLGVAEALIVEGKLHLPGSANAGVS